MVREKDNGERFVSQQPAIEVLKKLGYEYLSPKQAQALRGGWHLVLLRKVMEDRLKKLNCYQYKGKVYQFSDANIRQAIHDLDEPRIHGLVKTSEKIYELLLSGKNYTEMLPDGSRRSFPFRFIDWDRVENNIFHVTEEFVMEREDGQGTIRPDLVLFVNGIPFAVIECKKSSISVKEGISQIIRNQGKGYIPDLFKFVQIVMATNKNESKYATCGTPAMFWSVWKEEHTTWLEEQLNHAVQDRVPTNQDRTIISLFHPQRLLELTRFFTLYDKDVKKIARYQQYFAIKEIMKTVSQSDENGNREGGVIWHTQGSGKSLTMVMLARVLLSDLADGSPKVVVVTDRVDLDKQIHRTFRYTRTSASRARSGKHLVKLINDPNIKVMTTLVHKFKQAADHQEPVTSRDIFLLVDESHRTQYGELHLRMRKVFPNACYLGFTGTPLMKKEKNTMVKFGKLIHTYTIADGIEDKAIVPLLYEGKMVEQTVNRKAIDNRLEMITRNLTPKQKEEVMRKWSQFERIASSDQRINMIAFDINKHFLDNYKLQGSPYKAMLAANSRVEAIRYLNAFEELGDLNCAVVISPPDQREGHHEVDEGARDLVQRFWQKMMERYGDEENYEESIKSEFVDGDELDLLVVVDKLLTGFDAPRATVLYIDKPMKEHNLLQAIARVNRLYEGKDYGLVVDYRGLLDKLDEALEMYSGAGLENFDPKDLKGVLYDVMTVIGDLRQGHSRLSDIFKDVHNKSDSEEYEVLLAEESLREEFYATLSRFGRHLGIALSSEQIYNALGDKELTRYKNDFKFYQELRRSVKLRYSDSIDHKEFEPKMQKLMDQYISAEDIIRITNPVDIMDEKAFEEELDRLKTPRAKADAIRTRISKRIETKYDENPAYYRKFSERIESVLKAYKEKRISEKDYLKKMKEILKNFRSGTSGIRYPVNIRQNPHAQAFYGEVVEIIGKSHELSGKEELIGELSLKIEEIIRMHSKVDWHYNIEVHKRIEQDLDDLLYDFGKEYKLELNLDQIDQIIETVKTVALRRF
ncbi:HsdR family type I site-specific deoxyribonuclease [Thermoactinomyces sp. CICC 10521]|uniref:type I restriction endonuclease subunit R n=1 Tax=Thermoactinomyces sp. CICC 10521 TaxID=2767426 RepID=UPI0018DE5378|nr:HsdR family type I site-specific deoxyribonuclease [Thermoactinomyces sp. CICC 10521]